MKNVTVSLPDEVCRWTRVWAAEHDTSVSAMLSSFLKEKMESERNYETAMKSFLKRTPKPIHDESGYPSRQEIHER